MIASADSPERRRFLAFLMSSPVLIGQHSTPEIIKNPEEALNLLGFEAAAKKVLPPAHYAYLATGVEHDATLRANRAGFNRYYLRPRRLVDIHNVDLRTEVFGATWDIPIGFAPIGNSMAFHPEGEIPVCRARGRNVVQVLSTNANTSVRKAAD